MYTASVCAFKFLVFFGLELAACVGGGYFGNTRHALIMNWSNKSFGETAFSVLAIIAIVWFLIGWMKRVHDVQALIIRLSATAGLILVFCLTTIPLFKSGGYVQIAGVFFTLALGWCMAIVWVPAITGVIGNMFGSLFDGGTAEADPKPFYSIFHAQRKKGNYQAALVAVRQQLDKFPTDFEGQMLLAELQAENLNDLPGADVTIQRLALQPGLAPANIAAALNHLADWHLNLTKDRDSAQRVLDQIVELLPDTEMALQAAQRIGRLADNGRLLEAHDRQRVSVKKGVQNLGLVRENGRLKIPEIDQGQVAAEYVKHLERHPMDSHTREKLAELYVTHYHRLDLALDQLEQLVQQPNHPPKQVVHWLNLMADLQVKEGVEYDRVRETLQRIIDQYPDLSAAESARRRLDILKLELRSKEKNRPVQLGAYEQNLGLKRNA